MIYNSFCRVTGKGKGNGMREIVFNPLFAGRPDIGLKPLQQQLKQINYQTRRRNSFKKKKKKEKSPK